MSCDQCPNEGECTREGFEYCELHDPDHKPKNARPFFDDLVTVAVRHNKRVSIRDLFDPVEV